jgi:Glyoxalase-like domain
MGPLTLWEFTLDCPEPVALAEFYRRLLGWADPPRRSPDDPGSGDWAVLIPRHGGPRLAFQRSDAAVTPWPGGARAHLDVAVPDLAAAHPHLVACGARPLTGTPAEEAHPDDLFRVYADPVGHPFCATQVAAPGNGVIMDRADALARLDVFVGEWEIEARFPGDAGPPSAGPRPRSRFEWALDRQFLVQRTEVPVPEVPDSLAIVSVDPDTGAYTQHYYDSRGVVRLYAMTLADRLWTLTRESADFTPLHFRQRFVGTVSEDGDTIAGAWEMGIDGGGWRHDFALTYRRVG